MTVPLEVRFRHADRSEAVEAAIRDHAERLERFEGRVQRCEVVVTGPHQHSHKGAPYQVVVHLDVAGADPVVSRTSDQDPAHGDVYVAVRDAFKAATRQLEVLERR